jgi:proline dehydrogenase
MRIDMEDSPCTTATLEIYRNLRDEHPDRVGIVLQSRLRRTLDDVDALIDRPTNFRLCKGIYLEPREIAYTDAELIRRNFVLVLDRMMESGAYVGIATHDELLVWESLRLIRKYGLDRDRYEFQMLLGVDEPLRRILIDAGHRLRVYVPYGEHWYPYSVRRLRENPQIAGYALKALFQRG